MREVTFQALIDEGVLRIGDGYRAKLEELGGTGYPFLRSEFVDERHIAFDNAESFHAELEPKLKAKLSCPGDTVITTKGNSTGRAAYVRPELRTFVYSPHLSFWRSLNDEVLHPGFLREWAHSPEFTDQLNGMKDSTDMAPYLSLTDQRRLRITVPEPDEQRAIARVLGALDDKIELNRRMNRTLEELSEALFRAWFVDFEPVVAKAAGRAPFGLAPSVAALFPAAFTGSELGPIPQGWRVRPLAEIADINGRTIRKDYQHAEIEYVDISAVSEGQLGETTLHPRASAPSRAQRLVAHGDTIWSCVRPNRRSFLFIANPPANLVVSTGFAAISPRCPSAAFIYAATTTDEFTDYLVAHAEGSAYPAVRPDTFAKAPLVVPSDDVVAAFDKIVGPWLAQAAHNVRESRTLAALRDTLLPKLLSGELRVRDAVKLAEAPALASAGMRS